MALNGSVKMVSNGGQKLLLQALVYEVVTVCIPSRKTFFFVRNGKETHHLVKRLTLPMERVKLC